MEICFAEIFFPFPYHSSHMVNSTSYDNTFLNSSFSFHSCVETWNTFSHSKDTKWFLNCFCPVFLYFMSCCVRVCMWSPWKLFSAYWMPLIGEPRNFITRSLLTNHKKGWWKAQIFLIVRLLNFIHGTSYGSIMKILEHIVCVVCMIWISFVLCSFSWYFNLFLASFSSSFSSFFKKKKNETRERIGKFMENKIYDKRQGRRERESGWQNKRKGRWNFMFFRSSQVFLSFRVEMVVKDFKDGREICFLFSVVKNSMTIYVCSWFNRHKGNLSSQ